MDPILYSILLSWMIEVPEAGNSYQRAKFRVEQNISEACGGAGPINDRDDPSRKVPHACTVLATGEIIINADWWSKAPDAERYLVVYHELGHVAGLPDDNSAPNIMDQGLSTAKLPWGGLVQDLKRRLAEHNSKQKPKKAKHKRKK